MDIIMARKLLLIIYIKKNVKAMNLCER